MPTIANGLLRLPHQTKWQLRWVGFFGSGTGFLNLLFALLVRRPGVSCDVEALVGTSECGVKMIGGFWDTRSIARSADSMNLSSAPLAVPSKELTQRLPRCLGSEPDARETKSPLKAFGRSKATPACQLCCYLLFLAGNPQLFTASVSTGVNHSPGPLSSQCRPIADRDGERSVCQVTWCGPVVALDVALGPF